MRDVGHSVQQRPAEAWKAFPGGDVGRVELARMEAQIFACACQGDKKRKIQSKEPLQAFQVRGNQCTRIRSHVASQGPAKNMAHSISDVIDPKV
jgi:hypothetical protein